MAIRSFQNIMPQTGQGVWVDPSAQVIGDVTIGKDSSVWPCAVIRGDMQSIKIGQRCSIQDGAVLHITHDSSFHPGGFSLQMGDDVTVAHQGMLHGCTLGSRIMIGMQAIVMDGAHIGDEVIVAAGSLVSPGKTLESGFLYRGRPARQVRALTADERRFLSYVAQNYVTLKDRYLNEGKQT